MKCNVCKVEASLYRQGSSSSRCPFCPRWRLMETSNGAPPTPSPVHKSYDEPPTPWGVDRPSECEAPSYTDYPCPADTSSSSAPCCAD